jgi:hypothetical protein
MSSYNLGDLNSLQNILQSIALLSPCTIQQLLLLPCSFVYLNCINFDIPSTIFIEMRLDFRVDWLYVAIILQCTVSMYKQLTLGCLCIHILISLHCIYIHFLTNMTITMQCIMSMYIQLILGCFSFITSFIIT